MKPRTLIIALAVLVVMIGSRLLFPIRVLPEVSVAAEVLGRPFGFPFTNSVLMTIVVDILLLILVIAATRKMALVPRGAQNMWELGVETFYGLGESVDRRNIRRMFTLTATIFTFILFANVLALVPGVGSVGMCRAREDALINPSAAQTPAAPLTQDEITHDVGASGGACSTYQTADGRTEAATLVPFFRSPSADLNTTLAIALIAFFAIEYFGFKDLGVGYLGKFFNFKEGPFIALVGFLELISEFVRIMSFTFRLFGNIFAGEVVLSVMAFLVPWLLPLPFYGLELFVAFMQAFIFAILTIAFINTATTSHHEADAHGGHAEVSPVDVAH